MSSAAISFRQPVLAWAVPEADERRFRRIARAALLACLVFGAGVRLVPLPEPTREQLARPLPPPLARLLMQDKPPAPEQEQAVHLI